MKRVKCCLNCLHSIEGPMSDNLLECQKRDKLVDKDQHCEEWECDHTIRDCTDPDLKDD